MMGNYASFAPTRKPADKKYRQGNPRPASRWRLHPVLR
jgi:hypothetical protein